MKPSFSTGLEQDALKRRKLGAVVDDDVVLTNPRLVTDDHELDRKYGPKTVQHQKALTYQTASLHTNQLVAPGKTFNPMGSAATLHCTGTVHKIVEDREIGYRNLG